MRNKDEIQLAVIAEQVSVIKTDVKDIKERMEADYVSHDEFEPVKKIVYAMVSAIGLAFIGAVIKLVFLNP